MAQGSKIEWTDATWNPVTGCNKISPGCKHCYAERLSKRLKATGMAKYSNGFEVTLHPDTLEIPLRWRKPRSIFVNSMSDLFHVDVPEPFIRDVFDVMERADWHRYQVLTKRAERVADLSSALPWPSQVWMGVSVESQDYAHRIDLLRETDAHVKFLSLEPLLGPLPSSEPGRHRLGHRRRRIRPWRTTHAARLGPRNPRPVHRRRRGFPLQAVGRRLQKATRPRTRRPHLGRNANPRAPTTPSRPSVKNNSPAGDTCPLPILRPTPHNGLIKCEPTG